MAQARTVCVGICYLLCMADPMRRLAQAAVRASRQLAEARRQCYNDKVSRIALLLVCLTSALAQPRDERLHRLFDAYFEDYLRANPEAATSLGRTDHNTRWRDWSEPARQGWTQRLEGYLVDLRGFQPENLNEQDRLSWTLLRRQLETELRGLPYDTYLLRLNQLFGLHTSVFLTLREMPSRSVQDYEDLLARLRAVPAYVDQNIGALRDGLRAGVTQPRLTVDLVVGQLDAQAAFEADESPLLAAFREMPPSVPEERRRKLVREAERLYREAFRPAWRKLREFLAHEYRPAARETLAVSGLADGAAIYQFMIERHTTLPLGAREIHELGKSEVARIDKAMEAVVREAGFQGTSEDYERHLLTAPEYLFKNREAMLAYHRDLALRILPELPRLFRKLPRHPFGIRAIPPDREAASASNYNRPAADGSRPGWFNLKAYRAEEQSRFDKPALVLHETVPGHHLQIALQLEIEGLPDFRKIYRSTAYIEGWALYAETLGHELGVYGDPPSRFGALESERFRARRLVVDTGLHAMGWTRQQALEYLGDASEVDRYIAWPGQALAYKLGQLKILELKAAVREAHGEAFDERDFHEAVLKSGPLPLALLEEQVGVYIAQAARSEP